MKKRITPKLRRIVVERASGLCEYCRSPEQFSIGNFAIEHVIPSQIGGTSTEDNLALSCQQCNNHKYTKTQAPDPTSENMVPLFHPRQHRWSDHFVWNEDFTLVIGTSPTGRATVEALHLNREGVVNLRRVLFAMNEHPPAEDVHS